MRPIVLIFLILVFCLTPQIQAQKVVKGSIKSQDRDWTYYLFAPDGIEKAKPAPMIVMLHGSGRNGLSLVDKWKDLAKKERIILLGPDSSNSQSWRIPQDGPDFVYDLVEAIKTKHPVNPRRVYLFGHSGGATVALYLALLESEYFAATAVHAGAMRTDDGPFIERSKRKIPISIFVGTNDSFFPLADVRATRDLLNTRGFNAQLTEIKGHTHDYYARSDEINKNAWDFLKKHELSVDPKYERYKWDNK